MAIANMLETEETQLIEEKIRPKFPTVKAYRYNSACIRVRIIDRKFSGKSLVEREKMVLPLIRSLPEETQADITVLLLLAPNETQQSMMNTEFEHPSPSRL